MFRVASILNIEIESRRVKGLLLNKKPQLFMIQIVKKLPSINNIRVFDAESISESKYYGVLVNKNKMAKGFIVNIGLGFVVFCEMRITDGNRFASFVDPNLAHLTRQILDSGAELFEFETSKELFKWISEI